MSELNFKVIKPAATEPEVDLKFTMVSQPSKTEEPKLTFKTLTPGSASQLPEDQPDVFKPSVKDIWSNLQLPSQVSREGLKQVTDMIPERIPSAPTFVNQPANPSFEVETSQRTTQPPILKDAGSNFVSALPKVGAEIIGDMAPDFISPEVLLGSGVLKGLGTFAKTASGIKAAEKLGEFTDKHIPTLKKWFTYRYGQDPAYIDAVEQAQINMRVGTEKVGTIANKILEMPSDVQRKIAGYMKGEKGFFAKNLTADEKLAADAARGEFKRLGNDLVDLKMLDPKTYAENVNTYLPRLYKTKELGLETPTLGTKKPMRMNVDRFKHRQDIPQDVREAMGEIMEAGYPTAKGLMQLNQAVEKGKMFRQVSQMQHLVTEDATVAAERGWIKMPVTNKLGDMSGKYAAPSVAEDLNSIIREKGQLEQGYKKLLGLWKYGKVVMSPATHARNMFTNMFWLDVSGTGPSTQAKLFPQAIREMRLNGPMYQEAKKLGLVGTEMVGEDVVKLQQNYLIGGAPNTPLNVVKKALNYGKEAARKLGDVYQGEEQLFKMVKFMDNVNKGMTPQKAALDAEKWIFNYNKISPAVKGLRETVIPFATYFSKAIPQLGEAAVNNPLGVYKYVSFFNALDNVGAEKSGVSPAQHKAIKDQYDVTLLPVKRKDGKVQTLDLNFLTPWGEAANLSTAGIPQPFTPSGPLFALNNALVAHYDPFTKKELFKETDPWQVKASAMTDYLGKALLPNLTPGVAGVTSPFRGGYHYREIADALKGTPSYPKKEVKSIPEALLSTGLGLKTRGIDPKEALLNQALKKEGQMSEIEQTFGERMVRPGLTKTEKTFFKKELPKQVNKVFEKAKQIRTQPLEEEPKLNFKVIKKGR
jgi:hypothetical protein